MGKEEKTEVWTEVGKYLKKIPHKYGHICVGFSLTSVPTSPRYATVTSTKNDLQYYKKLGQAK